MVPTISNDVVFTASTGIRTLTAGDLTAGSVNVTATSGTFSIRNETTTSTNSLLTLGGPGNLGNSVSGTATDLIYVADGSILNLRGDNLKGIGVLNLALGQSGTFQIRGSADISTSLSGLGFGFTKTGAGQLTLSGGSSNTYTGLTTVSAGTLKLEKTIGANAIGGNLTISGTGDVTFLVTGIQEQIANSAVVIVNGTGGTSGSTFNGTSVNVGSSTVTETIGSLSVLNGNFVAGVDSNWTVAGTGIFNGSGVADARFNGSSGSMTSFDSLSLTSMTGTVLASDSDSFVLAGGTTATTTVTVGSGGLSMEGSTIGLNRGSASGNAGSRLVLNGNVVTTGTTASAIASNSGAFGSGNVELSSTSGNHIRTFTIGGGGADLTVNVAITNGAATTGGIIKDDAGTLTLSGQNDYTGGTTITGGVLQLGNGSAVGSLSTSSVISIASGATFAVNQSDTATQGTDFSAAAITGLGGFSQIGSGTTILNANNTYDGATSVTSGTLVINGDQSAANGTVTVGPNGTLGGTGIIGGDTIIDGGRHAPGNSPGVITHLGNLTYNASSVVAWELTENNSSTAIQAGPTFFFDQVVVGGDLDFVGATTMNLTFNSAGSAVDWSDGFWDLLSTKEWLVYDVGGTTSNFGNLSLSDSSTWTDSTGESFSAARGGNLPSSANFFLFQSGNNIYLSYQAVPEPVGFSLLALTLGLVTMVARPRRRMVI